MPEITDRISTNASWYVCAIFTDFTHEFEEITAQSAWFIDFEKFRVGFSGYIGQSLNFFFFLLRALLGKPNGIFFGNIINTWRIYWPTSFLNIQTGFLFVGLLPHRDTAQQNGNKNRVFDSQSTGYKKCLILFRYFFYSVLRVMKNILTNVTSYITVFSFPFPFYCCRFTKPQTFADCIGNELPLGWEEAYDKHVGAYYINHVNRKFFYFCYLIEKVQGERPDTCVTRSDFIRNFMSRICAITCARGFMHAFSCPIVLDAFNREFAEITNV